MRNKTRIQSVGVLMGGFSSEREISLNSGTAVVDALRSLGYTVIIIDFKSVDELILKIKNSDVDCMFNALHGRFGEDGQVQKIMDDLKITYTGSGVYASQLAIDKVACRRIFQDNALLVPQSQVWHKGRLEKQKLNFRFPLVVKPAHEGSSIGLSIIDNLKDFHKAVEKAFDFDSTIIIEKYIHGRELTVGVLQDKPLPVIEIVPKNKFYDFQAKYTKGMTEYKVPAQLPPQISTHVQNVALKAHKLLGCRCFSRIDLILNKKKQPVVLEVNTIPGLTSISLLPKAAAASGINFGELCQIMIYAAIGENLKEGSFVKVLSGKG